MHLIESLKELILLCSSFQRKFKSSLSGQCSTCKTVTMWLKNLLEKESIHMGIGNGSDTYFNVLHCASLLLMVWCIHMFVFLACMKYVQDIGTFMKTVVSTQISCLYISDAWFLNGSLPPHPWYVVDQSKSLLICPSWTCDMATTALSSLELEQSETRIKLFCRPDLHARSVRGAEMCKETWWGSAIVELQLDYFTH